MKGGHQHITRGIKHFLASKNGLLNCFTTLRGTDIILFLQLVVKWFEDTGKINSLVQMGYQIHQNCGHCDKGTTKPGQCFQFSAMTMYHFQVFTPSEVRRQQWRLVTRSNQSPEPRVMIDTVPV